ncbi:hypothetical protein [Ciceribacter sp. L1K22]|uniref:hypothetical protein n=1 Tax=Ciceribacter sp. L1K22 TaxID=2820275 RepID=UPI001ABEC2DC|nr:hypothetical protein [Ciceribacter sp. L1K22]MBO3760392.1 hypothetical protein [Ciceribacter sp. L1K22]
MARDLPISFMPSMSRSCLDDRKTQTRRTMNRLRRFGKIRQFGRSDTPGYDWHFRDKDGRWHDLRHAELLPYLRYAIGDRLWVKETWQGLTFSDFRPTNREPCELRYAATDPCADLDGAARGYPWRPAMHMPRWASRTTIIVTDVRVEQVQSISETDAIAEGIEPFTDFMPYGRHWRRYRDGSGLGYVDNPIASYASLWTEINRPGSWEANPWVEVYTFRVIKQNIDTIEQVVLEASHA